MSNTQSSSTFTKLSAAAVGLAGVVQAVLGGIAAFGYEPIEGTHGIVGMVTFVLTILATLAAWLDVKRTGNKGLLMHAAGMAGLAVVQIALGELAVTTFHITLGVAFLAGAVALAVLAFRGPKAAPAA